MAKRKKHMKLPNGTGSIRYLGKNRRRPYGAYPPVTSFTLDGIPIQPKAIGYAEDWYGAYELLVEYRKNPAAYRQLTAAAKEPEKTFSDIYEAYYKEKYETDKSRTYSEASKNSTIAAYKNCAVLHSRIFRDLQYADLQAVVDNCPLRHSSLELIMSLIKQMYAYAIKYDIADKDYSVYLKIKIEDDEEHGVPFSDEDIRKLWDNREDPIVQMLLIMIYSGYRISAYRTLKVNLQEMYFQGGVKTKAGKDRIVPIHSLIQSMVALRMAADGSMLTCTPASFRSKMAAALDRLGMEKHTPHDCRHTFSALCEKYGVNEADRKRMLGHSFGSDITNGTYGHRTLEDLRKEIEKICY